MLAENSNITRVRTKPCKLFAKFNHFRSAVFLQYSRAPVGFQEIRETPMVLQKILQTGVCVKFGGNVAFYVIWPILLRRTQCRTR